MKMQLTATMATLLMATGIVPTTVQASPGLVSVVRDATKGFLNVSKAENPGGYGRFLGCVSDQDGAMGIHYANASLVGDGALDARHPEVLMYEPMADGSKRLLGSEFIVLAADWDASHSAPPVLMGQLLHYHGSPNSYGLPAFYALHVWAWKYNPSGAFADWNPNVSCVYAR
jgi:hypothetical protein